MIQKIYLDDVRTPKEKGWVVVRNYDEFVAKVTEIGLENIQLISLDHDLGETAMQEWHINVAKNNTLDYKNITEKTGMDCVKWLVEQWMDGQPVCNVMVHSANAIGSSNMLGLLWNYQHITRRNQDSGRWVVPFTMETIIE
jgi:hypothetical protein